MTAGSNSHARYVRQSSRRKTSRLSRWWSSAVWRNVSSDLRS